MTRREKFWLWPLILIVVFLFIHDCDTNVLASNIARVNTIALVRAFVYKDGALPKRDPRHQLIERTAKTINENCSRYDLDPALVAACIYAESSYDPKAIGHSDGESGVLQVHGKARAQCQRAGLDMAKLEDQVMCGTRWLSYLEKSVCGELFVDKERCLARRDKTACSGAMAAYISGRCESTQAVAKKVSYRLRLVRWAKNKVSPMRLY